MTLAALSTPPNIATNYAGWLAWKNARKEAFYANCPTTRATTYYVSNSGSGTGDGSIGDPFATLDEVRSALAANTRFRFNRGDEWIDADGLDVTYDNVTLDDYGTGDLPLFNRFTVQYPAASDLWLSDSGIWKILSVTDDIAWVRLRSDPLGEVRGTALILQDSVAHVQATANSFWYDATGDVLWINLDGDDPNDYDIEAVISNLKDGVLFNGDGCRAENLRGDGWGMHRTAGAEGTQRQPFSSRCGDSDANLYVGCYGYFSHSHVMAHLKSDGAGGLTYWDGCHAGYSHTTSGATTLFNTYALSGGNETWFDSCQVDYGQLKSYLWSYAANKVNGAGFFGHSGGAETTMGLFVVFGCSLAADPIQGTQIMANFANAPAISANDALTDCRIFVVNSAHNLQAESHIDSAMATNSNGVFYGSTFELEPNGALQYMVNIRPVQLYYINCVIDIDQSNLSDKMMTWTNGASGTTGLHLLHTAIRISNASRSNTTYMGWCTDYDLYGSLGGGAAVGAGNALDSRMINCILAMHYTTQCICLVGLTNDADNLKNNAYWHVGMGTAKDREAGYTESPVTLTAMPTLTAPIPALLKAGATTIALSHDMNGKFRVSDVPDIGPVDWSSPAGTHYQQHQQLLYPRIG